VTKKENLGLLIVGVFPPADEDAARQTLIKKRSILRPSQSGNKRYEERGRKKKIYDVAVRSNPERFFWQEKKET